MANSASTKSKWLTRSVTIPNLLKAIENQDPQALLELKTSAGVQVFSKAEAILILGRLSADPVRRRLETCEVSTSRVCQSLPIQWMIGEHGSIIHVNFTNCHLGNNSLFC